MTRPKEVSMHPKMMIALGDKVEGDRQRERKRIERRLLALQQCRLGATNDATRAAGHEFVRRVLVEE